MEIFATVTETSATPSSSRDNSSAPTATMDFAQSSAAAAVPPFLEPEILSPPCLDPSYLRPIAAPRRPPFPLPRTVLILVLCCSKPKMKTIKVELKVGGRRG